MLGTRVACRPRGPHGGAPVRVEMDAVIHKRREAWDSVARTTSRITLAVGIFHRRPQGSSAHCRFHDSANAKRHFTAYRAAIRCSLFHRADGDAEHHLRDAAYLAARQRSDFFPGAPAASRSEWPAHWCEDPIGGDFDV